MTVPAEPDDLRAWLIEALTTAPVARVRDDPEQAAHHAAQGRFVRHDRHNYESNCAWCRGEAGTLADVMLGIVQHRMESLEQQATNARSAARENGQRADEAESNLAAWDDARAEIHEQMRTGFAEMIRSKWDCYTSEPDADSAADACIDYLENEFAGQLARATTAREQMAAAVRAYADELYTAPRRVNACGVRERLLDMIATPGPTITIEEALASGPTEDTAASPYQVWPLAKILADVQCGSDDWAWVEEWADLDKRHPDELATLADDIAANGITTPVLIGNDGRLWDGHHRLRVAVLLGIGYVPVELISGAEPKEA